MTKPISDMSMEEFEEYFDNGGDISELFETPGVVIERPNISQLKQVSISLPSWLVLALDAEAARRGIARKAVINTALVEWVDHIAQEAHERGERPFLPARWTVGKEPAPEGEATDEGAPEYAGEGSFEPDPTPEEA